MARLNRESLNGLNLLAVLCLSLVANLGMVPIDIRLMATQRRDHLRIFLFMHECNLKFIAVSKLNIF
jgi:hypothetical protein